MSGHPTRRTKIVATLGPATDDPEILRRVIAAGVDVVRLNFSHGSAADHTRRAEMVRGVALMLGRDVGILADLQGPKIRIESFANGPVDLKEGQTFTLDTALGTRAGDDSVVGCAYTELPKDVEAGNVLLLNDGAITMRVERVENTRIVCTVLVGGILSDRKGINKQGGGLSAEALTDKDREDIRTAAAIDVDFVAVSFPRCARDMELARSLVRDAGSNAALVAKIERAEALGALRELVSASDVVMVARGDLGVEIGDAELPGWQKRIIAESLDQNKMVITATQMMESMIVSPIPTRAEVLDVANAVMDGTDAVMLSAETAAGKYPVKVVEAMARVCAGAESSMLERAPRGLRPLDAHFERTDEAIAMATAWTARHMHANAIVALTESGSTARMMSRTVTQIPVYALTRHEKTRRLMALCRGVYPVSFDPTDTSSLSQVHEAIECLRYRHALNDGDRVLLTKGDGTGSGGTNSMKIVRVGDH
ncbi:pyruvate kinase [Sinimarinibacterium sp. CAU 1509]|uniref:pyruvate kinase n=1 Tax=Sinimarinibacterium sp. CAU 1509 TaxID=2562283 RepID=UPI0010AD9512|nr:pyruvate kinase [Sinimarinibacterium sp. CAU 1509]TJY59831.1 pyruvate kinase [Sinimarinibacterium sp. CAU 1509]